MIVTVDDVVEVFPRPLDDFETQLAEKLVAQALELIRLEFARRGRDLDAELATVPWLSSAVKHAVRMMVSRAVLVGENVGRVSASSTTGPQSDSITFSNGVGIQWGGVGITPDVLALLGLTGGVVSLGRGGRVIPFGYRGHFYGAEGSERGRC